MQDGVNARFTIFPRMGRKSTVVAVLEEHSVKVATNRESSSEMANGGIFSRGAKLIPSQSDKWDTCKTCSNLYSTINMDQYGRKDCL